MSGTQSAANRVFADPDALPRPILDLLSRLPRFPEYRVSYDHRDTPIRLLAGTPDGIYEVAFDADVEVGSDESVQEINFYPWAAVTRLRLYRTNVQVRVADTHGLVPVDCEDPEDALAFFTDLLAERSS